MHLLNVRDTTAYRYSEPTGLGEHRSMFRPDDPQRGCDHLRRRGVTERVIEHLRRWQIACSVLGRDWMGKHIHWLAPSE